MLAIGEQPGRPLTSGPTRRRRPPVGLPARLEGRARAPTREGGSGELCRDAGIAPWLLVEAP
eukprot:5699465-Pyramimonas_sp.AAC.1